MGKEHNPLVMEVLTRFGIDPALALWDCHGTWVIYHRYCELIAEKAGIKFDPPTVIHHDPAKKEVVVLVSGSIPDADDGDVIFRESWSFGEVSPANNKNSYPWAMAEKRAKDRVILKLAGLAGHVYSEEEADEFKASGGGRETAQPAENKPSPGVPHGYKFALEEVPHFKEKDGVIPHVFGKGPHREKWDGWTWKQMAQEHYARLNAGDADENNDPILNLLCNETYIKGWNREQAEKIDADARAKLG